MESREAASLAVAGALLPVGTVGTVLWATAAYGFHWAVPLFLLFVSPVAAALGTFALGVRTGSLQRPSWVPLDGPPKFRDRIPERYHEEFAPETLEETAADDAGPTRRLLALALVYHVSIPVYALVLWGLFG